MAECFIQTSKGSFSFEPVALYHGRKKINKAQARRNLLDLKQVFDRASLEFGLIYGTLLGAVRDGDFISWDEDVDVFILDEDRARLHDLLWELRDVGINLVRMEGDLYSVMRDDDYIDIYVFRGVGTKRWCNQDVVDSDFLMFKGRIPFLGTEFHSPKDPARFLEVMYGADWRTPRQDYPARPWSIWRKFKRVVRDVFPFLAVVRDAIKSRR